MSSYWQPGARRSTIDLLPDVDIARELLDRRERGDRQTTQVRRAREHLPQPPRRRWFDAMAPASAACDDRQRRRPRARRRACITGASRPSGTEGYKKAEVTAGGVDTRELSSQTMEARAVPGLYFIGEVVDVTGWLGGYNFQWAWASGNAVGHAV